MKRIFTYGERPERRNLTVADLRACKGVRKLTQTNPRTTDEAAAAVAGGIDVLICCKHEYDAVRAGAPETFLTSALMLTDHPTDLDTIRAAMATMEAGADAVYTPRRPELVAVGLEPGAEVKWRVAVALVKPPPQPGTTSTQEPARRSPTSFRARWLRMESQTQ